MRYHVLACDYDGTLATHGRVDEPTIAALERLRSSGRKLVLVTGRQLDELFTVFPYGDLFDRIVAENGALLYRPAKREEVVLADPPPEGLVAALQARGVAPIAVGRAIVATWEPYQVQALEAIRDLSLEMQVIFNKGAVMLLPSGVNKATGLHAALQEMCLSAHNAVSVGDAENDHALLSACECGVAVANSVDSLKDRADFVTQRDHGAGVVELIERLVANDLCDLEQRLTRHHILVGNTGVGTPQERSVSLSPFKSVVLIAGTSGGGKTTHATSILERLGASGYQFCIVDPEGDYENLENTTTIGDSTRPPAPNEVLSLLNDPHNNAVVNLLSLELAERPGELRGLLARLQELGSKTGRPHWLIVDEAHHVAPASSESNPLQFPSGLSMLLLTVRPETLSTQLLKMVGTLMTIGDEAQECILSFAERTGVAPPPLPEADLNPGECLLWRPNRGDPIVMQTIPPSAERRRHRRKYAEGELGEDRSFYFRGKDRKLNLRVHNLIMFIQIGQGVGEDVWKYHLRRGDYSAWFRTCIKDDELADEAAAVERRKDLSAADSRAAIENAIRRRYTAPVRSTKSTR